MPQANIADSSAQGQVRLGKRLAREKARCFADGRTWKHYVASSYDFSRERADELIRIGLGLLSVEEARAAKRRRTAAYRLEARDAQIMDIVALQAHRDRVVAGRIVKRLQRRDISQQEKAKIEEMVHGVIAVWEEVLRQVVRP